MPNQGGSQQGLGGRGRPAGARVALADLEALEQDRLGVGVFLLGPQVIAEEGRLGVTPAQLRRAVKSAGPVAKDVRRQLGK